jgi:Phosphate-selective porin O and P
MKKNFLLLLPLIFVVCFPLNSQDTVRIKSQNLPSFDGILKTKLEYDLDNSKMRFEVRNARFGVKGKINDLMSYRLGLDLNDEGIMKMLDAYLRLTPFHNFDIYLGQRKIPFSTDYIRDPIENMFANRSFIAKYINEGLRDIGFYADYKLTNKLPVDLVVGAVNGTGNNNPQWIKRPNYVSRVIVGPDDGFRIAGNLYCGQRQYQDKMSLLGGEIRYSTGPFFIESEYVRRNWTDTLSLRQHDDALYIHSYYNFTVDRKFLHLITPVARWDMMGNKIFRDEVDASRITLGVNFGFEQKQFCSEIRLNYENYFKSSLPIHTDKLTIEFVGKF